MINKFDPGHIFDYGHSRAKCKNEYLAFFLQLRRKMSHLAF